MLSADTPSAVVAAFTLIFVRTTPSCARLQAQYCSTMDEQSAGIVTLYYIKQLSPSDAACSKQIKLPRTQARRFVGDLRHKQRAAVVGTCCVLCGSNI